MSTAIDLSTRTARVHLDAEGIVVVTILPGMVQSGADAVANLGAAVSAASGLRRPVLVDIRQAEALAPEVRRHYCGGRLPDDFSALAVLVQANPVGRMLGNLYLRIAKIAVPIKLFDEESAARAWLRGHA